MIRYSDDMSPSEVSLATATHFDGFLAAHQPLGATWFGVDCSNEVLLRTVWTGSMHVQMVTKRQIYVCASHCRS